MPHDFAKIEKFGQLKQKQFWVKFLKISCHMSKVFE